MGIKYVSFFGGRIWTRPRSLRLKRGDEVRFRMSDGAWAGVSLSFSSPSPFGQSTLLLRRGERASLFVHQDVPKRRVRIAATPRAELPSGGGIEGPVVVPGPVVVLPPVVVPPPVVAEDVPYVPIKDPPGTKAGDIDVTPD